TTSPTSRAPTSTSRATWPSPSPSNEAVSLGRAAGDGGVPGRVGQPRDAALCRRWAAPESGRLDRLWPARSVRVLRGVQPEGPRRGAAALHAGAGVPVGAGADREPLHDAPGDDGAVAGEPAPARRAATDARRLLGARGE